jgi:hypothetical protein
MDDRHHDPDAAAAAERAARAVRSLDVSAPPHLHRAVQAAVADARRPARSGPRGRPLVAGLGVATAIAALALVLALVLTGSSGETAPTVPEAAQLALARPTGGAPAVRPGDRLAVSVDGIDFPDWSGTPPYRWRADGARTDELSGRTLRTVTYASDHGERIGYAIARGDALPWGGGTVHERNGVRLWVYDGEQVGGATVVAWLRDGHTCILAGRGVEAGELMRLASSRNA